MGATTTVPLDILRRDALCRCLGEARGAFQQARAATDMELRRVWCDTGMRARERYRCLRSAPVVELDRFGDFSQA